MRKILFVSLAILLFASCESTKESGTISLSADDFATVIAENSDIQILDVRTRDEYAKGHIPNSINIDVKQNGFGDKALTELDKDNPVAVYCRSGRRSKLAATILTDMGYSVYELNQGIVAWKGDIQTK